MTVNLTTPTDTSMRVFLVGLLMLGCSSTSVNESADGVGGSSASDAGVEFNTDAPQGGYLGDPCDPDAHVMFECGRMIYEQCFPSIADGGNCNGAECVNGTCSMKCTVGPCS